MPPLRCLLFVEVVVSDFPVRHGDDLLHRDRPREALPVFVLDVCTIGTPEAFRRVLLGNSLLLSPVSKSHKTAYTPIWDILANIFFPILGYVHFRPSLPVCPA